ncbi:MAG: 3-deoxy-manno-octulosonate cytidylyltransferase [Candidatus Latescibacterota bacterium]|nr:MAG: 3-deoxy-manno-octulosonate cytidylyltransferase [Candidatus Latescibacterota bacterium]
MRYAIIPARFASTRFPGKALALLAGKPLVVHVLERVEAARVFDAIWVATDDERIAEAVRRAGGSARMTRADHGSGTERIAEAAASLPADALVCNVQGDEPLLPPALLRDLVAHMDADPTIELATVGHPSVDAASLSSPNVVKVVCDNAGRALYFSRAPIPHTGTRAPRYLRHVGIYAFRRRALTQFVQWAPGRLEQLEGLEQLRALENGMPIHVVVTQHDTIGVDTPEDLKAVASRLPRFLESSEIASQPPRGDAR